MKTFTFALIFFLGLSSLEAQSQSGSEAIAKAIVSSAEDTVGNFADCVEKLVRLTTTTEKAISACKDVSKIASHTATRVANEAADATKASRPIMVADYGGYGGGYSYRDGWGGRRSQSWVVSSSAREERNARSSAEREARNARLSAEREARNAAALNARMQRAKM